jgi:CDP-glucose 4,6-dehydratase
VRAGNVIGGGDWARDRLLPDCARALAAGQAITVRSPASMRPWQYVLEPLAGYLWLAASSLGDAACAGPWNFGPPAGPVAAVREVVERFAAAWGGGTWRHTAPPGEAPKEAAALLLDSAKAERLLGWRTVYDLDDAIGVTAAWYRAYYAGDGDIRELSAADIGAYQGAAAAAGQPWAAGAMREATGV